MVGKPQYDEAAVVDAAVSAFWRHGYTATSINVLTEETGLSRSSLYQRFGDKDGLFQAVLAAYIDRVILRMTSAEGATSRAKLEALMRGLLPVRPTSKPPGCLLVRSCSEMGELPEEGKKAVLKAVETQRELLSALLQQAVSDGELPPEADIDALAWHFIGVLHAIVNLPQAGATAPELERMIAVAMSIWPETAVRPDR